ncbi:MAG: hypothetical protein ACI8RZ_003607 [Myxococcota bacterium]|jgi:hypothetical protein
MRYLSLLALLGCTGEEPTPAVQTLSAQGDRLLTLVYTNNLDGEIDPCG